MGMIDTGLEIDNPRQGPLGYYDVIQKGSPP
jgi:hypothetical protein